MMDYGNGDVRDIDCSICGGSGTAELAALRAEATAIRNAVAPFAAEYGVEGEHLRSFVLGTLAAVAADRDVTATERDALRARAERDNLLDDLDNAEVDLRCARDQIAALRTQVEKAEADISHWRHAYNTIESSIAQVSHERDAALARAEKADDKT